MKFSSCILTGCLSSLIIAGLTGCSSPSAPYPSLMPTMANPPAQPVPVWVKEPAPTTAVIPDTTYPVPSPSVPVPNNVFIDGSASVPGAADPWLEIKDFPFDQRADFNARADSSVTQLDGAASVARLTLPKPDMDDAHATAIRRLDIAMTSVDQTRSALSYADADGWESAKNNFHTAWQNAQAAYAQARASGN